jgi:hypothetical protein
MTSVLVAELRPRQRSGALNELPQNREDRVEFRQGGSRALDGVRQL